MKILVAGEVKGRLDLLFTRVAALHASKAGAYIYYGCMPCCVMRWTNP
jgi:hypothetical protein